MNGADHTMLGGYIPACWATLRRWQDTQASGGKIVTPREALNLRTQMEFYRTELKKWQAAQQAEFPGGSIESRPQDRATAIQRRSTMSDLQSRQKEIALAVSHNEKELENIKTTLKNIDLLEKTTLELSDVYGDRAELPDLKAQIERWSDHKENQAVIRVAQIPQGSMTVTA
jgi:hypothetical protein